MTEFQMTEVGCMKTIDGDNFPKGIQEFPFSIGRPTAWIPSKSYFLFDMTLQAGRNGTANGLVQPTYAEDQLAFADSCAGNLYTNIFFKAGGQPCSSIVTDPPQAAACKKRLNKTGAWLNTIGRSAYMFDSDFERRSKLISAESKDEPTQMIVNKGAADGTIAVVAATGVATAANNATFANVQVGDVITIANVPYTVVDKTSAANVTVAPRPPADIAATDDFTITRTVFSTAVTNGKNRVFVAWQPPIGIMDHDEPLGAGDYRFSLMPNTDFEKAAVQSLVAKEPGLAAGNFKLTINDVKLYVATVKMEIPSQVQNLYLMEAQVHSKVAHPGTMTYQFTLPPSTRAISVFFQQNDAGQNTLVPPSKFTVGAANEERNLQSIQLTYANQTRPNTRWASKFSELPPENRMQQRYVDNLQECNLLDNTGGAESLEDFMESGLIIHYGFNRDASDRSTQLQLSTTFDGPLTNALVYVIAWHSRVIELTTDNGMIVSVRALEA